MNKRNNLDAKIFNNIIKIILLYIIIILENRISR